MNGKAEWLVIEAREKGLTPDDKDEAADRLRKDARLERWREKMRLDYPEAPEHPKMADAPVFSG